ncbi:Methylamine utilization protein mauG [Polaromonas sp. CG9_12]|nr:Methylamine utilization protein mauG [Polaromonas sp. CG9_12]
MTPHPPGLMPGAGAAGQPLAPAKASTATRALSLLLAAKSRLKTLLFIGGASAVLVFAAGTPQADEPLRSMALKTVDVPGPSNDVLDEFVDDKSAAIQLGKALFWDPRVGSDNKTACATCHFSAGADTREKNQLSPGLLRRLSGSMAANPDWTFQLGSGPNRQFTASELDSISSGDFPFTRFSMQESNDPAQRIDINDVASSQGVFHGSFDRVNATKKGAAADSCNYSRDPDGFHMGAVNTRRVEPRNSPSVINAVFNFRNFWDGRGNNVFNGGDPFGLRNQNSMVWKKENGIVRKVSVGIQSSSLASQGSGPPLSGTEMSCSDRTFVHLGQKLLDQDILSGQVIAPDDSVLGRFATGGRPTYRTLVKKAFRQAYWQSPDIVRFTQADARERKSMDLKHPVRFDKNVDEKISQLEANFTLFFSLAIQMYETTLVSDDSRFDQFAAGDASKLNASERAGFAIFQGKGRCINCHGGAELTNASFRHVTNQRLETMVMATGKTKTYDAGFYNIGVRPTLDDIGIGGNDGIGLPLSESMLFAVKGPAGKAQAASLLGNGFDPDRYGVPGIQDVAVNGAFKTPGLRNVELTGPYFHNGGKATLMQVVDFYNRGGDFGRENREDLAPDIQPLGLSETEKADLVRFLMSLTDERVRMEKAPFDHPSLCLPNGHSASAYASPNGINAGDETLCIKEVGRKGRTTGILPFMKLSPLSH